MKKRTCSLCKFYQKRPGTRTGFCNKETGIKIVSAIKRECEHFDS